jgi:hypothetical protein
MINQLYELSNDLDNYWITYDLCLENGWAFSDFYPEQSNERLIIVISHSGSLSNGWSISRIGSILCSYKVILMDSSRLSTTIRSSFSGMSL